MVVKIQREKPIKYLFLLFLLTSCLSKKPERKVVSIPAPVYMLELTNEPVNGIIKNVTFSSVGASFGNSQEERSHIQMDSLPKIPGDFNISFWFRVVGQEGKTSQTLFKAFNSQDPKEELRVWVAGHRVTGSLNSNRFSTKGFSKNSPSSRTYYDLPRLEIGKFYFMSINKIRNKVEMYINAERYQEYILEKDIDILMNSITFGVFNTEGPYTNQFYGNIRNFEIFKQPLTEDEIYSVSVQHFHEIEPFNDEFEINKFNFEE